MYIGLTVLNATELYALKWLTLCYVNYTSIKKTFKNKFKKKRELWERRTEMV